MVAWAMEKKVASFLALSGLSRYEYDTLQPIIVYAHSIINKARLRHYDVTVRLVVDPDLRKLIFNANIDLWIERAIHI